MLAACSSMHWYAARHITIQLHACDVYAPDFSRTCSGSLLYICHKLVRLLSTDA